MIRRFLHKIRYLKNHEGFRRYSSNTLWSIGARAITQIVSFIVAAYVIRYLGPSNYGQLSYAVSFVGIFGVLTTLGIDSILYRNLIENKDKHAELLGTAFMLKLFAGLITYVITVITAFYIVPRTDISHFLIWIISLTYIFNSLNIIVFEFQAHVEQKAVSIVSFWVLIALSALKLSVVFFDKGIIYFAVILAVESILYSASYIWLRQKKYFSIRLWSFDRAVAGQLLRDSWPLLLASSFTVIYSRVDQVIIKYMLDNASVGIYDAAVKISEAWISIPILITTSLFPSIVNARKTSFASYRNRTLALALFLGAGAVIVSTIITIFSKPIMHLLYGPAYDVGLSVLRIYCWSGVWMSIGFVTYYYLLAENKTKLLFYSSLFAMIVNIALNILLIPIYGIEGAAWATFVSYIAIAFPLLLIILKKPEEGLPASIEIRTDGK